MNLLKSFTSRFKSTRPPKPEADWSRGTDWKWHNGEWREYCKTCGGNCGQCGMTSRLGTDMPASMGALVKNLYKKP